MHGQNNNWLRQHRIPQALRNAATDAEQRLWQHLRGQQLGAKFRRQHLFNSFVLDFVCLEAHLVVELDGGQHAETQAADAERDRQLHHAGFRVLRFWNNQVIQETSAVLESIAQALAETHPGPARRAGFAQPARFGGAEQCSAKPRLNPLEGKGEEAPGQTQSPPLQGEG